MAFPGSPPPPPQPPHGAGYPPPPQPPPKKRRWPWIVGGLFGLLVLGVIVSPAQTPAASSAGPRSTVQQAPAAPAASGPATTISDGVYEVGTDIEPGKYKTPGPNKSAAWPMCYVERAKDDSGQLGSIIANDNLQGPGVATVKAGQVLKLSGGCTWTKAG